MLYLATSESCTVGPTLSSLLLFVNHPLPPPLQQLCLSFTPLIYRLPFTIRPSLLSPNSLKSLSQSPATMTLGTNHNRKEKGTEISGCDRRRWKSVGETDGDRGGDRDKSPVGGRRRSSGAENQRSTQEVGKRTGVREAVDSEWHRCLPTTTLAHHLSLSLPLLPGHPAASTANPSFLSFSFLLSPLFNSSLLSVFLPLRSYMFSLMFFSKIFFFLQSPFRLLSYIPSLTFFFFHSYIPFLSFFSSII